MKTFSWRAAGTVPLVLLAIVSIATTAQAAEKKTPLEGYVAAADTSYAWTFEGTDDIEGGRVHRLTLVSQTWQEIVWKHLDQPGGLRLEITSKPEPVAVQLWSARSKTLDFRKSKFTMTQMQRDGDVFYGDVQLEPGGHVVLYGHLIYTAGDLRYGFSTQVRVK